MNVTDRQSTMTIPRYTL